jgi:hypothetical protein
MYFLLISSYPHFVNVIVECPLLQNCFKAKKANKHSQGSNDNQMKDIFDRNPSVPPSFLFREDVVYGWYLIGFQFSRETHRDEVF